MIKTFLTSVLSAAMIGLFIADLIDSTSEDTPVARSTAPEPVSLLKYSNASEALKHENLLTEIQHRLLRLETATPGELRTWLNQLNQTEPYDFDLMQEIAVRLARHDPREAVAYLKTLFRGKGALACALGEWAKTDLEAAMEAAINIEKEKSGILGSWIEELTLAQCEDVFSLFLQREMDPTHFSNLFHRFIKKDPEQAAKRLVKFASEKGGSLSSFGLSDAVVGWYQKDAHGTLQWVMESEVLGVRGEALGALARVVLKQDGMSGYGELWEKVDVDFRKHLLFSFQPSPENIEDLLEWADANVESQENYYYMLSDLVRELRDSEHPEMLAKIFPHFGDDLMDQQVRDYIEDTTRVWVQRDPQGVEDWLETVDDPFLWAETSEQLLEQWMQDDPLKGIAFWEEHQEMFDEGVSPANNLYYYVTTALGEVSDPRDLLERVPEEWHGEALGVYAHVVGAERPEEAMRFLDTLPPEDRYTSSQVVVSHWAARDPEAASEWFSELTDPSEQRLVIHALAISWASHDAMGAQMWLKDQSSSPGYDLAAEHVATAGLFEDPAASLSLMLSIPDGESRDRILEDAVSNLARRDADAALLHAESAGLEGDWIDAIDKVRALSEHFEKEASSVE